MKAECQKIHEPAPRWRPLPCLANTDNLAMNPHKEGETQAPNTLIRQWEKKGTETGWGWGETASERSLHAQQTLMHKKRQTVCILLQRPLIHEHIKPCHIHVCIARQC